MVLWMLYGKNPGKTNRIVARLVDYFLFFLAGGVASLFIPILVETYFYYLFALSVPILWMPIESFFLTCWGTTPGKALFGIKVHDELGLKLSFWNAFKRAMFIFPRPGVIRQVQVSFGRRVTGLTIGLACIFISFFGNALTKWTLGWDSGITAKGWIQYDSKDAGFSVQFPNDPVEASKRLEIPSANKVLNYQEVASHQNKHVHYSVSYMDFPKKWKWAGTNTLLKGALDAIVKHTPNAELLHREFTSYQGYRSMDFCLQQEEDQVKGRLIIVGTKLYMLTIVYPPSLADRFKEDPFFNSFDLNF
jgi:uncharacterized RDD family membrane protein YckC